MPFYDYRCDRCGNFRALRPMSESRVAVPCPGCGTLSERVLMSPFLGGGGRASSPATAAGVFDRSRFGHLCGAGCVHGVR